MKTKGEDVRNIAIIVHIDHGKTTLVDQLLRQSGVFRANQEVQKCVMDSSDLERGRRITTLSENTTAFHKDTKINIVDTPGHADLGGEMERVSEIVDGIVLVVDTYEGPMPQTKFVLQKALGLNLSVIICINRIDGPETKPTSIIDETLELMMDLDAADEQLDCPFIYASVRDGFAKYKIEDPEADMSPLFEAVINRIPAPKGDPDVETQVLISTIDCDEFVGRVSIGRVDNGGFKVNQECALINHREPDKFKEIGIGKFYEFNGLERAEMQEAGIGSIVVISGIASIHIGDTICTPNNPESIPFQRISELIIAMYFMVNDSPLVGQEGKFITSRHLRNRLFGELNMDVSLRMEKADSANCFRVFGHGELHLSVLIKNMRHEDFEFAVSKVGVLYKYNERNRKLEPMELAYVDMSEEYTGVVVQKLANRKGAPQGMSQVAGGYSKLEFSIPSRELIGYRGDFLTDTRRNGILDTIFDGYTECKGDLFYRQASSLIALEAGKAITCGLFNAQERGTLFIRPGARIYSGMVVDQNPKAEDIEINICKTKKSTNTRSSGVGEAFKLTPPKIVSLEQALDFIGTGELLEVTPESLRVRKEILDPTLRKRASSENK